MSYWEIRLDGDKKSTKEFPISKMLIVNIQGLSCEFETEGATCYIE